MRGKISKIIRDRGFGFIDAENKKEVFFHRSALEGVEFDDLTEGSNIEFTVEDGPKGPRAVNIKLA